MPVLIPADGVSLRGDLSVPSGALGLVVFAHGSGSGRLSPRNQFVARHLIQRGFATLLIDLLTEKEEAADALLGHLRFDIALLSRRLGSILAWSAAQPEVQGLSIGLFGASTGGGAALVAAAEHPGLVSAVVSRGGRPDLAGDALSKVTAPTLLIVGDEDLPVIALNREAMAKMTGRVSLQLVPGATHLFEEPGALEIVADSAERWFQRFLRK